MADLKRIGVLLAAGRSTRMGRPKQLLPWPPNSPAAKPLVAAAFDAIACVCDEMCVVVDHQAEAVIAALGDRKFRHCLVLSGKAEMIISIRLGIDFAAWPHNPDAQLLMQPADHPEVRRATLDAIISAEADHPECAVMPTYRGKGGHPVLIPPGVAKLIGDYRGPGGLRQFWMDRPDLCIRIPVGDPGAVFDIDTQTDYDLRVQ